MPAINSLTLIKQTFIQLYINGALGLVERMCQREREKERERERERERKFIYIL